MENNIKDKLIELRELIGNKERWTQGASARDKEGKRVLSTEEEAVSWCISGGINKVLMYSKFEEQRDIRTIIQNSLPEGYKAIGKFNDKSTHEEVINMLNRVIDKL